MVNLHKSKIHIAKIVILTILFCFTGTTFFTISLGIIHLFPFRIFVLLLWGIFLTKERDSIKWNLIKVKWAICFLLFWVVYAILSLSWADNKIEALKHIIFLFMNVSLVFFIVYYLRELDQLFSVVKLWMVLFVIMLPIGFWEVSTGNHLPGSGLLTVDEGYEFYKFAPTTFFGNQNDYATIIALSFPMFYVSIGYLKRYYFKLGLGLICVAGLLMLIFTTSRANYIGVLVGFLFWFLFVLKIRDKFKIISVILSILIIVALNLTTENWDYLNVVWEDFSVLLNAKDAEGSINIRSNLIKNGIYFAVISFGFGIGAGNIEHYMSNYPKYFVGDITNVHNWWIELLVNYGIVIFVGYLILYIGIFVRLWKYVYRLKMPKEKIICEALLCGMVTFSISSISSSSLIAFYPQWAYFGLALAFISYVKNKNLKDNAYTYNTK